MTVPSSSSPESTRRCGSCTACCVSLDVTELAKPAGTACVHLKPGAASGACTSGGCGIFQNRTEIIGGPAADVCAGFRCGWLQGHGTNADRPDRSGVILRDGAADGGPMSKEAFVQAHEVAPGSLERPRAKALIQNIARQMPVVLITIAGDKKLIGNKADVERLAPLVLPGAGVVEKFNGKAT